MNISIVGNRVPVVSVCSTVNAANADELGAILGEAIMVSPNGFIVDLSCVDIIDSTAVSVMLRAYRSVVSNGGRLTVVTGPHLAVRAMTTMLLKELPCLHVAQDLGSAMATMLPQRGTLRHRSLARRTVERLGAAA